MTNLHSLAFLLTDVFSDDGLLPHGTCFLLRPDLIWLHVTSDAVIALSYFLIPAALVYFMRSKRLSFSWAIALFAAFIVLCGISHIVDIATIWKPIYYLQGYEKALTAAVSLLTAITIVPLVPKLARMRSPEELEAANNKLAAEVLARQEAETGLRRSLADLNRAVRELEQFAYITSHDLQAPLRSISGFSQLLTRRYRPQLQGDALEFLDFIDKGSRQMQGLIQDLLTLSRVGRSPRNKFELHPLSQTIQRSMEALRDPIEASRAEVVFTELPSIVADHGLLAQLFQNLIGNAIKFQKPGNVPRVTITAQRDGDRWSIQISDNGIGIPADQLENVFAIFRRLHTSEEYEGTGIGLAICRKIVEFHGGEIWVTSGSEGSCFHVRLMVNPVILVSPSHEPLPAIA